MLLCTGGIGSLYILKNKGFFDSAQLRHYKELREEAIEMLPMPSKTTLIHKEIKQREKDGCSGASAVFVYKTDLSEKELDDFYSKPFGNFLLQDDEDISSRELGESWRKRYDSTDDSIVMFVRMLEDGDNLEIYEDVIIYLNATANWSMNYDLVQEGIIKEGDKDRYYILDIDVYTACNYS